MTRLMVDRPGLWEEPIPLGILGPFLYFVMACIHSSSFLGILLRDHKIAAANPDIASMPQGERENGRKKTV